MDHGGLGFHELPGDGLSARPRHGSAGLPFQTNVLLMPEFTETPEQIRSEIKVGKIPVSARPGARSCPSAKYSITSGCTATRRSKVAMMDTKLHARLAAPWTCLVVVLIALPFGAASGRRNVFVGVASSIVICFGYFVLRQLALALGTRGTCRPGWRPGRQTVLRGCGPVVDVADPLAGYGPSGRSPRL